ncbi:MAG: hypothetical protein ACK5KT_11240 [Dysgonomonas sp.]
MKHTLLILFFLAASFVSAQDYPNVRISASGGFSYFPVTEPTGQTFVKNSAYDSYNNHLKWGRNVDGNVHYILNMGLGFGAKYRYINVSAPPTDLFVDIGSEHYGVFNLQEKNDIQFIAPSIMFMQRLGRSSKFMAVTSVSVGYTYLQSIGELDGLSLVMTGSNIGYQFDLGLDYFITKTISIGLNTGYFSSTIKGANLGLSEKKTALKKEQQPNLSNIKLNASLAINL